MLCKSFKEILARAPEGSDLVGLFDLVRRTARNAGTSEKVLDKMRVAVAYPLPANPFAEGLNEAEHACNEARVLLNSVLSQKTKSKKISSTQSPALAFQLFLVSAILEFRLLHIDYVPAILRSLEEGRIFSIHSDKIWASPLSLNYGSQQNAERRLLILRQGSLKRLKDFLALEESEAFLRRYSSHPANSKADCLNILEVLECEAWQDPLVSRDSVSAKKLSNAKLIDAAQKIAMLEMPSVVVAHRSRRIVSHSLPPEVLARISGKTIKPFKLVRSDWLRANKVDDDPDAEVPNEAGEGMPWLGVLREALVGNQTDETLLKELAAGASGDLRIMASFALYLARPKGKGRQQYKGGGCGTATVRRYCLLIATKVVPRVSEGALLRVTEDAWENGACSEPAEGS
jgi:hypothetical protein